MTTRRRPIEDCVKCGGPAKLVDYERLPAEPDVGWPEDAERTRTRCQACGIWERVETCPGESWGQISIEEVDAG